MRRSKRHFAAVAAVFLAPGLPGGAQPPEWVGDPCGSLGAPLAAASIGPSYPGIPQPPDTLALAADDLWDWVRRKTGLAETTAPPAVWFVSAGCLRAIRRSAAAGPLGIEAVYAPDSATVFLRGRWRADSLAARSILVHEFVHHAQALSGRTFACPAAAEKQAYALQEAWLAEHGLDFEQAIGLGRMARLVLTECGM